MGSERVTFKTADGVALKGDFFRAGSRSQRDCSDPSTGLPHWSI